MTRTALFYVASGVVFSASIGAAYLLSNNPTAQAIAALPIAGSLLTALWETIRDRMAHDRATELASSRNRFELGATSHMAAVAFDKLVKFSEEYVEEVQNTLTTLFQEGPTDKALKHAAALYTLQRKHSLWISAQVSNQLGKFETALRRLGAQAHFVEDFQDQKGRPEVVANMYKTFANMIGAEFMGADEWEGEKLDPEKAILMVVERLKIALGIEELNRVRQQLIASLATQ